MAHTCLPSLRFCWATTTASVVSIPETTTSYPELKKFWATWVGSAVTPGMLNQNPIQLTLNLSSEAGLLRTVSQAYRAPR